MCKTLAINTYVFWVTLVLQNTINAELKFVVYYGQFI